MCLLNVLDDSLQSLGIRVSILAMLNHADSRRRDGSHLEACDLTESSELLAVIGSISGCVMEDMVGCIVVGIGPAARRGESNPDLRKNLVQISVSHPPLMTITGRSSE